MDNKRIHFIFFFYLFPNAKNIRSAVFIHRQPFIWLSSVLILVPTHRNYIELIHSTQTLKCSDIFTLTKESRTVSTCSQLGFCLLEISPLHPVDSRSPFGLDFHQEFLIFPSSLALWKWNYVIWGKIQNSDICKYINILAGLKKFFKTYLLINIINIIIMTDRQTDMRPGMTLNLLLRLRTWSHFTASFHWLIV